MTLLALSCPRCGASLTLPGGARVVECHACGGRALLALQPPQPLYSVAPQMDRAAATAAVREFLRQPPSPAGLASDASILAPRLYFVPYHEITGRRIGVMRRQVPEVVRQTTPSWSVGGQQGALGGPSLGATAHEPVTRTRIVEKADTKVLLADVQTFVPAFGGSRWDLVEFDAAAARLGAVLNPADVEALQRRGTVLSSTVPVEGAESRLVDDGPASRVVGVQRRTVLFPFWLVPFRYRGARYEVLLSAASPRGRVVWAATPGSHTAPTPLRLAAILAGLLLGLGLRGLAAGLGTLHLTGSLHRGPAALAVIAGAITAGVVATRVRSVRPPSYHWLGDTPLADEEP